MKPTKHTDQTPNADHLDRVLDSALAKYSAVEPRAGLEERVLVQLRSDELQPSRRVWLRWGLAAAVAAVAVVAVLAWRSSPAPHTVVETHPPVTIHEPSIQAAKSGPDTTNEIAMAKHTSTQKPAALPVPATIAAHPKLEQFPSPQPLSAEEIALAHYVKNFPKEAQLVARAQEEFAIETQKEMNDAGSGTRSSDSIQQER